MDPVAALGPLIRDLRRSRDMTLAAVAGAASLSVGHLSQVERGLSTPTIRQLQAIAAAMGVTIGWFFQADGKRGAADDDEADVVVRAGRRRRMAIRDGGIVDELLVPDLDGPLELLHCTLQPGVDSGPEAYSHDGAEAGLLLAGEMELFVDGKRYHLTAGDSFSFESTRPHRYRSIGAVPLRIVWAITPPTY